MSRMEPDRIDDKGPWKLPDHRELEGGYPQVPRHLDVLPSGTITYNPGDVVTNNRIAKLERQVERILKCLDMETE